VYRFKPPAIGQAGDKQYKQVEDRERTNGRCASSSESSRIEFSGSAILKTDKKPASVNTAVSAGVETGGPRADEVVRPSADFVSCRLLQLENGDSDYWFCMTTISADQIFSTRSRPHSSADLRIQCCLS
jgi:hypothetical protein